MMLSSSSLSDMMLGCIAGVGVLALLEVAFVRLICGGEGMLEVAVVRLICHILAPLADAPQYDSTVGIIDRDIRFGESDSAIGIAENSHAEKIIDDIGHDFPCGCTWLQPWNVDGSLGGRL